MSLPTSAEKLKDLVRFGIGISSTVNLDLLMVRVVETAKRLTGAKEGKFYLLKDGVLQMMVPAKSSKHAGPEEFNTRDIYSIPVNDQNILGYCAVSGEILNMSDVKNHELMQGGHNHEYSEILDCCAGDSMMLVPVVGQDRKILGILQLKNAVDNTERIIPFSDSNIPIIKSLASQSGVAINNAILSNEIKSAYYDTIFRLSLSAECRDKETANHIRRVSYYSAIVASHAGYSKLFQDLIQYASPMHDVGKISIPDSILFKTGKLTSEERSIMESHTTVGARIFHNSDYEVLKIAEQVALCHHERYDGSGYPNKLKGSEIPVEGRIVAIVDVFDAALAGSRRYKKPMPLDKVYEELKSQAGLHLDPRLIKSFFKGLDEIIEVKKRYSQPESDS